MDTQIVGIDCATEDSRIGLAVGGFDGTKLVLESAQLCDRETRAARTVAAWLMSGKRTLLAVDAPLGWPTALGDALREHRAGLALSATPDKMFRRTTDEFIRDKVQKTPLDVGADRIARTAHAALSLLQSLRTQLKLEIPLAWTPDYADRVAVIEVYPAATLVACKLKASGYKKKQHVVERRAITQRLRSLATLPENTTTLEENADVLDAVVCAIAGADFLAGVAMAPPEEMVSRREGWIWLREPKHASAAQVG